MTSAQPHDHWLAQPHVIFSSIGARDGDSAHLAMPPLSSSTSSTAAMLHLAQTLRQPRERSFEMSYVDASALRISWDREQLQAVTGANAAPAPLTRQRSDSSSLSRRGSDKREGAAAAVFGDDGVSSSAYASATGTRIQAAAAPPPPVVVVEATAPILASRRNRAHSSPITGLPGGPSPPPQHSTGVDFEALARRLPRPSTADPSLRHSTSGAGGSMMRHSSLHRMRVAHAAEDYEAKKALQRGLAIRRADALGLERYNTQTDYRRDPDWVPSWEMAFGSRAAVDGGSSSSTRLLPSGFAGHEAVIEHEPTGHLEVLAPTSIGPQRPVPAELLAAQARALGLTPAQYMELRAASAQALPVSDGSRRHHRPQFGASQLVRRESTKHWQSLRSTHRLRLEVKDAKLSAKASNSVMAAAADTWEHRHRTRSSTVELTLAEGKVTGSTIAGFDAHLWEVRRNRLFASEQLGKVEAIKKGQRKEKRKAPFDLYKSIWAPRCKWADSRDLFDTVDVWRRRFERDWGRCLQLGLIRMIQRNDDGGDQDDDGDGVPDEVDDVGRIFWRHVSVVYAVFPFYATMNHSLTDMSLNEWTAFVTDCDLVSRSSKACKGRDFDTIFVEVNGMARLWAKSNPSLQGASAGGAWDNAQTMDRAEFLIALVKIAINKYIRSGELDDVGDSLDRLLGMHIPSALDWYKDAAGVGVDPDAFRRGCAYSEEMCSALKANERELHACFDFIADSEAVRAGSGDSSTTITEKEWVATLRKLAFIGTDISERDALRCFTFSMMAVVDDETLRGRIKSTMLPFEGFMEALCRMAAQKALPSRKEVEEAGFDDASTYMQWFLETDKAGYEVMLEAKQGVWGGPVPDDMPWRIQATLQLLSDAMDAVLRTRMRGGRKKRGTVM